MRTSLILLVLLLAGCGSEDGGEDGRVQCTEQEGLAPCCDQTPLTAADCPQGTTFQLFDDPEHDVAGEACVTETGSGAEWVGEGMGKIKIGEQTMSLAEMAAHFEAEDCKDALKKLVTEAWQAREARLKAAVLADRKPRFS